jgi:hypothetical protein
MKILQMKHLAIIAAVPALFCAATPVQAGAATKDAAAKAIATAAATMKTAAGYHNQWLETDADFKDAKVADAKGDYGTAIDKANRANTLAKLSIEQSKSQQKVWQNEVPK